MDFGLDGQLWKTMGNQFIIKGITPGTHLFYWRHSEDSLITTGKFYELRDGDSVSWVWDAREERFSEDSLFGGNNVPLTKYQQSNEWYESTSEIVWCERYFGHFITSIDEIVPLIPPTKKTLLRGPELTASVLDKSSILESLPINTLLSELQCAFLVFKFLRNWCAWECWRDCLQTICCSAHYCNNNIEFMHIFLELMRHQLPEIDRCEMSSEIVLIQKWLTMLISDCAGNKDLEPTIDTFNCFLTKKLNWNVKEGIEDDEDDAPQLVLMEHE